MARNPIAKLVMAFFLILDIFFIVALVFAILRSLVELLIGLAALKPLSIIGFIGIAINTILFFLALWIGEWLWKEIEE
jgi:uncharacterized protein with PQ loop repeat